MVFITNPNTADFVWGNDGIGGGGARVNLSLASHECNDNPSRLGLVGISVGRFLGFAIMESTHPYKLAFGKFRT